MNCICKNLHQSGEYVGVDKEGKLHERNCCVYGSLIKTVYTFRCSGHSRSHFNRQWLTKKIVDNIDNLLEIGLNVRGIITDNHSANVNAFSALTKTFSSESNIT